MRGRRQILLLLAIMLAVALCVEAIALYSLYHAAFEQQRQRLSEIAQSQALLIEAVAKFDAEHSPGYAPGGPSAATLSQVVDAQEHFKGFGGTGQFVLGKREGDQIVYLLEHRFGKLFMYPASVPVSAPQAQAMRRALDGESGTIIYRGFRGKLVLAAYEPVRFLNWGIVAKMDLSEIRAPFTMAGLQATAGGLLLIILGAVVFLAVGNPLVRRLEENERKYRSIFESAADRLLLTTPDGIIVDANPAASSAYGFARGELVGRDVKEVVHADQHPYVKQSLKLVSEGKTFRRESVHLTRNGETFPVEVQLSPIIHRGRAAVLVAVRDISARKKAEQALQESEARYRDLSESLEETVEQKVRELQQAERLAAIGAMVSVVAHEVRNPLQSVHIGVETLKTIIPMEEEARELFEEIDHGINMLRSIVNDLLDYSRPVKLEYAQMQAGQILRRALNILSLELQNVRLTTELEQEDMELRVDVSKIIGVLLNVLANAVEAMPQGGEILIRSGSFSENDFRFYRYTVSDTGMGISEENLKRVFEPFFTTKTRGTGLGLAICKKIIEAHNGSLKIQSKVKEGTTVEIILPV